MSYSWKHIVYHPPYQLLLSLGTRDQRFTQMAVSLSPSLSLLSELYSFTVYTSLSSHQLVDIWVVSSFWQLGSNLFKHLCTGVLYVHIIFLGKYLGLRLLGYMVVWLTCQKNAILFFSMPKYFCIPMRDSHVRISGAVHVSTWCCQVSRILAVLVGL